MARTSNIVRFCPPFGELPPFHRGKKKRERERERRRRKREGKNWLRCVVMFKIKISREKKGSERFFLREAGWKICRDLIRLIGIIIVTYCSQIDKYYSLVDTGGDLYSFFIGLRKEPNIFRRIYVLFSSKKKKKKRKERIDRIYAIFA